MLEAGANPWQVAYQLFERWEPARLRLLSAIIATLEVQFDGRVALMRVTRQMLEICGANDDMVEGMVDQRPAGDRQERFRAIVGQRPHPGAKPGCEDHRGIRPAHSAALGAAATRASVAGSGGGTWRRTQAASGARAGWDRSFVRCPQTRGIMAR